MFKLKTTVLKIAISLFAVFYCLGAYAQTSFKSLNYLYSISGSKTVSGQQGDGYWETMRSVSGKYPAMWGEDLSFVISFGGANMADDRMKLAAIAKQRWASGALVNIMFHACPPTMGEPCSFDNVKSRLTDAQWTQLITNGTSLNNAWKARLDAITPCLLDLKNNGVEVIFRPFHEMNHPTVFWWAGRPGVNGSSKLFQITKDYLVNTKGLTNLVWNWNLQDFGSLASDVNNYDPGSSYYDMASLDVYYSDGTGITTSKYNTMVNKAGSKPIAIGELDIFPTASQLSSMPKWTYFLGWRELTQQKNTNATISSVYNAANVVTQDEMPGWSVATCPTVNLPGTIQAENYCTMSGVVKETTTDAGGGQNVGSIETGDWMSYKVNIPSTGAYTVQYRIASLNGGGSIRLEKLGGGTLFGTLSVPATGGWQTWQTISHTVQLTAGEQDIAIAAATGGFNVNWMSISGGGGSVNLAYNRPVTVSSTENATNTGAMAVDANGTTRWSSAYTDVQWIYVDLGATYNVSRVKISWEAAYGKNYYIEGSTNASTWTNMKTVTNNTALVNDNTGLSGSARYIRMYGTARGTAYGYSIFELEVYGTLASANLEETEGNMALSNEGGIVSAYPNPFTNKTTISLNLPQAGHTVLNISGLMGNRIAELYNGHLEAGHHEFSFDSNGLVPGFYIYSIVFEGRKISKKLIRQ